MSQPNAQETWVKAAREDKSLLPNKKTLEYFKGNGGIEVNPDGGICHVYDMQTSNYITDYDPRRINGLNGTNTDGTDGWSASAYGVFQDVYFDHKAYALGRHRSLAYRLHTEKIYSGDLGYYGTDSKSSWLTTGESLEKIGEQMVQIKKDAEEKVIGVDMDKYNMMCACNGHISGRAVPNTQSLMDNIFDGDCANFHWVAQPGPYAGADLPPRFAPIQCIEMDTEHILKSLSCLDVAWNTLGITSSDCVILMDPRYAYSVRNTVINPFPTDGARQELIDGINIRDGFKLMGFNFSFDVPGSYYPHVYVDENLNVVHSADGTASYDQFINSITPSETDKNPLLTKLIGSHRMGVNNFVRTEWDSTEGKFVKKIFNYPLGETGAVDYFGEKIENEFSNYQKAATPVNASEPGAGYGIPGKGHASKGYAEATGPVGDIVRRRVIGLCLYPEAVCVSQMYSNVVTDEGKTRGKFTEMCWDVKYDCFVLEKYAAGIIPILKIDDDEEPYLGVTVRNTVKAEIAGASATTPVFTKEVAEAKTKAKK